MSDKYLHREDAPFGASVWQKIDEAVVGIARARLAGRRLLPLDGPHGLALKAFAGADQPAGKAVSDDVTLRVPVVTPLPSIEGSFSLSVRDVAAFEAGNQMLDLKPAAAAICACADQEDALAFNGAASLGLPGLLTAKGVQVAKLGDWRTVGAALENITQGINLLDAAGFAGPYALALAPALYNRLFRRYPDGNLTELEHLGQAVTGGIVKAAAIEHGGVLVTSVKELAALVVGQDLVASYVGPSGRDYAFAVSETVVLRLTEPACVCVLR